MAADVGAFENRKMGLDQTSLFALADYCEEPSAGEAIVVVGTFLVVVGESPMMVASEAPNILVVDMGTDFSPFSLATA